MVWTEWCAYLIQDPVGDGDKSCRQEHFLLSPLLTMIPITVLLALTSMVLMSPAPQEEEQAPMPVNAFQSFQWKKYFLKNISVQVQQQGS